MSIWMRAWILKRLPLQESGAVGSDLVNIINEAALSAVRHRRMAVTQSDLFESVEVVIAGKAKKDRVLSAKERKSYPIMRLDMR